MPPPESKHEQIADQLRTQLAAISADASNFWFTPTKVVRVSDFLADWLDIEKEHVVLIRPGEEQKIEDTSHEVRGIMEVWIVAARRHAKASANPYLSGYVPKWLVQNRVARDVEKKIREIPFTLAENFEVTDVDRDVDVDGWAIVQFRLVITYSHLKGSP